MDKKQYGIFEEPEVLIIGKDEVSEVDVVGGSYGEAVVSGVASGVAGAIAGIAIPGPGIPG